jgi:inner membrane protein
LTPGALAIATIAMGLADVGSLIGGDSLFPGGPADELAHLLSTLLVLWALGPRVCRRFLGPALIASVAIDIDHIPMWLGLHGLSAGTPRPYPHSLLTLALVLTAALMWPRRRDPFLGLALGLAIHLWRDLADPGSAVSLLWPFSYHWFSLPHASYLLALAAVVGVDAHRCRGRATGTAPSPARWRGAPVNERSRVPPPGRREGEEIGAG